MTSPWGDRLAALVVGLVGILGLMIAGAILVQAILGQP